MKTSRDIGDSILEQVADHRNLLTKTVLLSGGVGGALLARGLGASVAPGSLTVIVNVGDDEEFYGVPVSPDLDTVVYTMAGIEGPHGWGIAGDTFTTMEHLASSGVDTRFKIGDRDFQTSVRRQSAFAAGQTLSEFTAEMAADLAVPATIIPATDDRLRTWISTAGGERIPFQEYFVLRGQTEEVMSLEFEGAGIAHPAPGALEAVEEADIVVIGPSNPPLSIWPILAVPGFRDALEKADPVIAVSPLFGGKALRGPADRVMASLGLPPGNAGVLAAYEGLLTDLVVDRGDAADQALATDDLRTHTADTRIAEPEQSARFSSWLIGLV